MGDGTLTTGPDGTLLIKNLAPGKYGVQIVPPVGGGWHQTSTIEGTKTIDAWVKANEPSYFQEFGPPGHHVFIGFVQDFNIIPRGPAFPRAPSPVTWSTCTCRARPTTPSITATRSPTAGSA
jgi:hypothetical protein